MKIALINTARSQKCLDHPRIQENVTWLKLAGFEIELIPESESPEIRARNFVETIQRKDIDFTWCVRGGIESIYLLPFIEFRNINPQSIIIGSSDFTHLALPLTAGGATVWYGPNLKDVEDAYKDRLIECLRSKNRLTLVSELLKGEIDTNLPLVGGTLMIVLNMFGINGFTSFKGKNLLIEHHYIDGETESEMRYWLTVLKNKLNQLQPESLVISNLQYKVGVDSASKTEQIQLINDVFQDCKLPIAFTEEFYATFIELGHTYA